MVDPIIEKSGKWIITGGRDFFNHKRINRNLQRLIIMIIKHINFIKLPKAIIGQEGINGMVPKKFEIRSKKNQAIY
jgi:hypothetical protein